MSNFINKEKLAAGIIFGDLENEEYIYMPGSEIGSTYPVCIYEHHGVKEDLSMEEAAEEILRLHLRPLELPTFSKI